MAIRACFKQNVLPDLVLIEDLDLQPVRISDTENEAASKPGCSEVVLRSCANLLEQSMATHGKMSAGTILKTARHHAGLGFLTNLIDSAD
jgi:hypothetical protein